MIEKVAPAPNKKKPPSKKKKRKEEGKKERKKTKKKINENINTHIPQKDIHAHTDRKMVGSAALGKARAI